jgi:steroid delta-isomerase-like uncharacterized protein
MNTFSMATGNKELVRRFVEEVVNRGRTDLIPQLVADNYVFHCPDGDLYGRQGALLNVAEMHNAFPDAHMDITELISEGELVARRFVLRGTHRGTFLGLGPSGDEVAITGLGLDRIANGRIAETWIAFNIIAQGNAWSTTHR